MALNDEIKAQWQEVKKRSVKERARWLWEYYKIPALVFGVCAALVIWLIVSIVTNKPVALNVTFLNFEGEGSFDETAEQEMSGRLADAIGVDLSRNEVEVSMSNFLAPGESRDEVDIAMQQRIIVYVSAGQIDVLCADAWNFTTYSLAGMFTDLRTVLPADRLAELEPYLYYVDQAVIDARQNATTLDTEEEESAMEASAEAAGTAFTTGTIADLTDGAEALKSEAIGTYTLPDPSTMQNPVPVGILMTDAPLFKENGYYTVSAPIMGIPAPSTHQRAAVLAMQYLWDGTTDAGAADAAAGESGQ